MNDQKISISKAGLQELEAELTKRKNKLRKKIADDIDRARQQGDLSENSAYKTALENKEFNEARIEELENMVLNSKVIEKKNSVMIGLGNKIKLKNKQQNTEVEYDLVGEQEADTSKGRISINSPLGSKLLGKKKGDMVKLSSPAGEVDYEILTIN